MELVKYFSRWYANTITDIRLVDIITEASIESRNMILFSNNDDANIVDIISKQINAPIKRVECLYQYTYVDLKELNLENYENHRLPPPPYSDIKKNHYIMSRKHLHVENDTTTFLANEFGMESVYPKFKEDLLCLRLGENSSYEKKMNELKKEYEEKCYALLLQLFSGWNYFNHNGTTLFVKKNYIVYEKNQIFFHEDVLFNCILRKCFLADNCECLSGWLFKETKIENPTLHLHIKDNEIHSIVDAFDMHKFI